MSEPFPFPGNNIYDAAAQIPSDFPTTSACLDKITSIESPSESARTSRMQATIDEKGSKLLQNLRPEGDPFTSSNEPEPTSPHSRALTEEVNLPSIGLKRKKEHRKSRNGCYNCKRRKIKCTENQPACRNCMKVNASCKYPPLQVIRAVQSPTIERSSLQPTPTVFDPTDMRLFHHFVVNAYPHLPLGNDNVWVREVAGFAHAHYFLMQAMLALSASHLMMTSTSQLKSEVLSHRVQAIRGLNNALSKAPKSAEESDAILATCWALALQTSYIGDSVEEFLTMMRGCTLIIRQKWTSKFGTAFQKLGNDGQTEVILPRLGTLPLINQDLVAEARTSCENLSGLCMGSTEETVFEYLVDMVRALSVSSVEAYLKYKKFHYYMGHLSHSAFQKFIDPSNTVAQLLLAHYVALLVLYAPIKSREWAGRDMGFPNRGTEFRLDSIWDNVPRGMRVYLEWPMLVTGSITGVPSYVESPFGYGDSSWTSTTT